jgi:hypothetical protein
MSGKQSCECKITTYFFFTAIFRKTSKMGVQALISPSFILFYFILKDEMHKGEIIL